MTIASKLIDLNNVKQSLTAALTSKGLDVSTASFQDMVDLVDTQLGVGGGGVEVTFSEPGSAVITTGGNAGDLVQVQEGREGFEMTAITAVTDIPWGTSSSNTVSRISRNGRKLVMRNNAYPYVFSYTWSDALMRWEADDALVSAAIDSTNLVVSEDGLRFTVVATYAPFMATYEWVPANNRYELLPNTPTAPSASGGLACSADGSRLICGDMATYLWDSGQAKFVLGNATSPAPTGLTQLIMTPDGSVVFAVTGTSSPYLRGYRWSSTNQRYEEFAVFASPLTGAIGKIACSADGSRIAFRSSVAPFIRLYDLSLATGFYVLGNTIPGAYTTNTAGEILLNDAGTLLAVCPPSVLNMYKWSPDTNAFVAITAPTTAIGYSVAISQAEGLTTMVVGEGLIANVKPYYFTTTWSPAPVSGQVLANGGVWDMNTVKLGVLTESGVANAELAMTVIWKKA